jgi:hypothetical protein
MPEASATVTDTLNRKRVTAEAVLDYVKPVSAPAP